MPVQNDRTITIAGDFKQSVNVDNSLTNGEECSAVNFSHAEGYKSVASGRYSFAGGYKAVADRNFSFVWSGIEDNSSSGHFSVESGTFNIYPKDNLDGVYVGGEKLTDRITAKFSSIYLNENVFSSANSWSNTNIFGSDNNTITLSEQGIKCSRVGITAPNGTFSKELRSPTLEITTNDEGDRSTCPVATTDYVKKLFRSSLTFAASNYVKRNDSTGAIGSESVPVYIDANGNACAVSSSVAFRSSDSIGSNLVPLYLSGGSLVQSDANIGTSSKPLYMQGGSLTPITTNVGSDGKTLVGFNNGNIFASSLNIGGHKTDVAKTYFAPIYLSSGKITAGNATIGNRLRPIYMKNGSLCACDTDLGGGGGSVVGISSIRLENLDETSNLFLNAISGEYLPNSNVVRLVGNRVQPKLDNLSDWGNFASVYLPNNYQKKFDVSLTGTGNAVTSADFDEVDGLLYLKLNSAYTFPKEISYTGAATIPADGTFVGSLGISDDGKLTTKLGKIEIGGSNNNGDGISGASLTTNGLTLYRGPVVKGVSTDASAGSGNCVSSLKLENGELKVSYGKASGGSANIEINVDDTGVSWVKESIAGYTTSIKSKTYQLKNKQIIAAGAWCDNSKTGRCALAGVYFNGNTVSVQIVNTDDGKQTVSFKYKIWYTVMSTSS